MNIIDDLVNQFANIPTDRQITLRTPAPEEINMALPQISVRDYLDLIPAFDGQPTKLSAFIEACENVLPLMAPNNEPTRITFTMLHIRNKLVGKAATLLAARNFTTFPELKNLLVNLFGDQRNEEALLSDLNTLRQQTRETALQFADRCIDIRYLLLSKLSCQGVAEEIRIMKINLYNNFTLRAFLTGVNPQLSHLLRCRKPENIEEAIQIVTEEENINYHRSKINHTTSEPQNHKPNNSHQLRINPPQIRMIPNNQNQQFRNFQRPNNTYKPMWPQQHTNNWSQGQNQRYFQNQPGNSQPRSQQNVFLPKNKPMTNAPTPMEVDSRRTRLSNQMPQSSRYPPQQNWRNEQLHMQQSEELEFTTPENNYSENPGYSENEELTYEDYYQEYETNEQENGNFPIGASGTTDRQN